MKFTAAFGVAHDQDAEKQVCQQGSHGGEVGALDGGSVAAARRREPALRGQVDPELGSGAAEIGRAHV